MKTIIVSRLKALMPLAIAHRSIFLIKLIADPMQAPKIFYKLALHPLEQRVEYAALNNCCIFHKVNSSFKINRMG